MKVTRNIFSILALLCLNLGVFAQATVQKIKINGLLAEWPNLQNNKSTGTFYQFYNDQKNFYIALKLTDDAYIKKALAGGLTLSINTDGKKSIKDIYQITIAPVEDYRTTRQFTSTPVKIDSATQSHRKEAVTKIKELHLSGFTEIPDSIISIYNTYGIKIGAKADVKGNINYELCIPLEQLKLVANNKNEVAINLQFNPINFNNNRDRGNMARNGGGYGGGRNRNGGAGNIDMLLLTVANDFWEKYTLQ